LIKHCFILIVLFYCWTASAQTLKRGYGALQNYDLFKAKKIFYTKLRKQPVPAQYGLATLFHDSLNHFHNLDSAWKYINLCEKNFLTSTVKQKKKYEKFKIDSLCILAKKNEINLSAVYLALRLNNIVSFNNYLEKYNQESHKTFIIEKRNALAYQNAQREGTWQAYLDFINNYPESIQLNQAKSTYEKLLYFTYTDDNSLISYQNFILNYPSSPFRYDAEQWVYKLTTTSGEIEDYYRFIKSNPFNPFVDSAWQAIYSFYAVDFSAEKIGEFRKKYPEYPYLDELLEDFEYARKELYPVKLNGLYGFIDSIGSIVIKPAFVWADQFSEGSAVVEINEMFGFVNKKGELIIEPIYTEAENFNKKLALVKQNERWGGINKKGKTEIKFDFDEINEFKGLYARAIKGGRYGFIDRKGSWIIKPELSYATDFENQLAIIGNKKDKKGVINEQLQIVMDTVFDEITFFEEKYFLVKQDNLFGLYALDGKKILNPLFSRIHKPCEGLVKVILNEKTGFFDLNGNEIIKCKFDAPPFDLQDGFENGVARVFFRNKAGIINKEQKWIIPKDYEEIKVFENLFAVKKAGKWGLLDSKLKSVHPLVYDEIKMVLNKLVARKNNQLWLINTSNIRKNVKLEYSDLKAFNSLILAEINGKWGLLDANLNPLLDIKYDQIKVDGPFIKAQNAQKEELYSKNTLKFVVETEK
jgi:hypothetical protein